MIAVFLAYLTSTFRLLADAAILIFKRWLKLYEPVKCHCQNRVKGKVVIVTGANSGIGLAIAQDLAHKGACLYLACRNHQAGKDTVLKLRKETSNHSIYFLHLDLQDFTSVRSFIESFLKREKHLDILIHNAAVFHHPPGLTSNQIEVTYQTNFLGAFLITSLLQSVIQQSSNSRIVFVSSEASKLVTLQDLIAFDPREAKPLPTFLDHVKHYGTSKLAVNIFAQYLSHSLPGVYVGLTDPGNVWTPIYRHSWRSFREIFVRLKCYIFMRDVHEGAQSTLHAINAPNPPSGQYINSCLVVEKHPYDSLVVQKLISDSVFLTGLPHTILPQVNPSVDQN